MCALHVPPGLETFSSSPRLYCFFVVVTFGRLYLFGRASYYWSGLESPQARFVTQVAHLPVDTSFIARFYLHMYPIRVLFVVGAATALVVSLLIRVTHNVMCATTLTYPDCTIVNYSDALWLVVSTMITIGYVLRDRVTPLKKRQ